MHAIAASSAALNPNDDHTLEALGFSGATLMQLWGIGIARMSDFPSDTETLRQQLAESFNGSAGARGRIEAVLQEVHSNLAKRNKRLHPTSKPRLHESDKQLAEATQPREVIPQSNSGVPIDYEVIDQGNEAASAAYPKDSLSAFYLEMRRYKLLSSAEHTELGRRWLEHKDTRARDKLVVHNIRLALSMARKHLWSKLELADLLQEGCVGLMIAAERWDYRKGFAFSTYAHHWIRQSITRAIMDKGDVIRIPVHLQELMNKVRRVSNEIAIREGRPPTVQEIAKEVERSPADVRQALKAGYLKLMESLNEPLPSSDGGHADEANDRLSRLADEGALRADHLMEAREELDAACERINQVTTAVYDDETIAEHHKKMFVQLYGLDGSLKKRTLDSVAEHFDITREGVRIAIVKIWEKLQYVVDMDNDSVLEDLSRIAALEKLAHRRVSAD